MKNNAHENAFKQSLTWFSAYQHGYARVTLVTDRPRNNNQRLHVIIITPHILTCVACHPDIDGTGLSVGPLPNIPDLRARCKPEVAGMRLSGSCYFLSCPLYRHKTVQHVLRIDGSLRVGLYTIYVFISRSAANFIRVISFLNRCTYNNHHDTLICFTFEILYPSWDNLPLSGPHEVSYVIFASWHPDITDTPLLKLRIRLLEKKHHILHETLTSRFGYFSMDANLPLAHTSVAHQECHLHSDLDDFF